MNPVTREIIKFARLTWLFLCLASIVASLTLGIVFVTTSDPDVNRELGWGLLWYAIIAASGLVLFWLRAVWEAYKFYEENPLDKTHPCNKIREFLV